MQIDFQSKLFFQMFSMFCMHRGLEVDDKAGLFVEDHTFLTYSSTIFDADIGAESKTSKIVEEYVRKYGLVQIDLHYVS